MEQYNNCSYTQQLLNFMNLHIAQTNTPTHIYNTQVGPDGSFKHTKCYINSDDLDQFYYLCKKHLENPERHITIFEMAPNTRKLFIDIDFNDANEVPLYTLEELTKIIKIYNDVLLTMNISQNKLDVCVLEMDQNLILTQEYNNGFRNGIHIIYPKIKLDKNEMIELHTKVKNNFKTQHMYKLSNAIDTYGGNLNFPGFGKPLRPAYKLTKIFSHDLTCTEVNDKNYQNNCLKMLSIRP